MSLELIASFERGATAPFVWVFDNIPQDGTDLMLVLSTRSQNYASGYEYWRVNSTASYFHKYLRGSGSTVNGSDISGSGSFYVDGVSSGNGAPSGIFGSAIVYFPNYSSTTKEKTMRIDGGAFITDNGNGNIVMGSVFFDTTAAITRIETTDTVAQYSSVYLYKIKS